MYNQRVERNIIANISKIDKSTLADIYHVSEYCADIQKDMQRKELSTKPDSFYMKRQTEINENVRAILVDWLISVHLKFKLLPETLYITVNLIDRYFSMFNVQKAQVQLVGIAALLIATKYEEIYPPTVKEFIYLTDDTFTRKEVLDMERKILFNIEFGITETSSYRFLERYSKIAKADSVIFFLAQYLLELALLDSKMNQYLPSMQASTALYVAMRVTLTDNQIKNGATDQPSYVSCWTKTLQQETGYSSADLKSCAKNYFQLANLIQKSELQAILRKFKQSKFLEVARIMCNVINDQSKSGEASNTDAKAIKSQGNRTNQNSSSTGKN
jgi:cyclin B